MAFILFATELRTFLILIFFSYVLHNEKNTIFITVELYIDLFSFHDQYFRSRLLISGSLAIFSHIDYSLYLIQAVNLSKAFFYVATFI